jgi:hypothetical protein
MKDICIFVYTDEVIIGNELKKELELIGARTDVISIPETSSISQQMKDTLSHYSSVILLISGKLSTAILQPEIKIKKINKKIIIFCYYLKNKEINKIKKNLDNLIISKSKTIPNLAFDVIKEISNHKRKIKLTPQNEIQSIWDSPLTIFRKREGLSQTKTRDILVDVTWSALPTREEPAPALISTLKKVFAHMGNKKYNILDFGAGKLRHTVILLEENHKVTAVEYEHLFINSTLQIKRLLETAKNYVNSFGKITYPSELISLDKKFDLIILINVINIIPDPLERLFVLEQCNFKLNKGKYLLWFTQHGDFDQRKSANDKVTDGGCAGLKSRRTFYTEFDIGTINVLLEIAGFKKVDIIFDSGNNQALLFKKVGNPIINFQQLGIDERRVVERKAIYGTSSNSAAIADVINSDDFITISSLLEYSLKKIISGKSMAYSYETCIKQIIEYIFSKNFVAADIDEQYKINKGRCIIDLKASWKSNSYLRDQLQNLDFNSSWVPIECKNYSNELGNNEFAQITMRCNIQYRKFGILTCRKINDENKLRDSQQFIRTEHGFIIIVLDDNDLNYLLKRIEEMKHYPPWLNEETYEADMDPVNRFIIKRIEEVTNNNIRKPADRLLS